MGRSYKGSRKKFASKKHYAHKTRSKWTAQNQTRLRSLNVDVLDFVSHEDSSGVSLHKPVAEGLSKLIQDGLPSPRVPERTARPSTSNNIKTLPPRLREVHIEFCQRQIDHIHAMCWFLNPTDQGSKNYQVRLLSLGKRLRQLYNIQEKERKNGHGHP